MARRSRVDLYYVADDPGSWRVRSSGARGGRRRLRRLARRKGGMAAMHILNGRGRGPAVRTAVRTRRRRGRRRPPILAFLAPRFDLVPRRRGCAEASRPTHHLRPGGRGARHAPPDPGRCTTGARRRRRSARAIRRGTLARPRLAGLDSTATRKGGGWWTGSTYADLSAFQVVEGCATRSERHGGARTQDRSSSCAARSVAGGHDLPPRPRRIRSIGRIFRRYPELDASAPRRQTHRR